MSRRPPNPHPWLPTKPIVLMAISAVAFSAGQARAQQAAEFRMEFTDARQTPSHWLLLLHPDGTGTFDADGGQPSPEDAKQILAGDIHRSLKLSPNLTDRVFATARARRFFDFPCESHWKVAFQGTKRFAYSGPERSGACEFNFSKDKEIEDLASTLLAVETTLLSGARLEKLLQHDRLGLDAELDSLVSSSHDGSAMELGAIRDTLTRIASDEQVLDRARRKARQLLAQAP